MSTTATLPSEEIIDISGARVHNLKNVNVALPRNQLIVITGLSGSGKSSLAFDTLYAEGQRRYIETFSAYARQFLGNLERPDVDQITGLSPVISIEQKTVSRSPRSTVGTITEIYDFLRLLFARVADAYSYETGEKMVQYNEDQIVALIADQFAGQKIDLLAPVVKGRKGHYRELLEQIARQGYLRVRIDGTLYDLADKPKLDRYKVHDIEIVVDRLLADDKSLARLKSSVATAMAQGKGVMMVLGSNADGPRHYSRFLMCPTTGISYPPPEPNLFSFNSPYGACPACNGLGEVTDIDLEKVVPNPALSVKKGALAPLGAYKNTWIFRQVEALLKKSGYTLSTPIAEMDEGMVNRLLEGSDEPMRVSTASGESEYSMRFEGIVNFILRQAEESASAPIQRWAQSFLNKKTCPTCNGTRLRRESLYFRIGDKHIADLNTMDIASFHDWTGGIMKQLSKRNQIIAKEIVKEISARAGFLLDVGLGYLSLNRGAGTLSGGEAQRIRLATQIGSQLVGVLYILDEPSIGLHQRDNHLLIGSLKKLRDGGNTVIVVEHDKDMMEAADYIVDIGPGAGAHGGRIVSAGTYKEFIKSGSLTSRYLNGSLSIEIPSKRRKGNGQALTLTGATGNNLKNVSVKFPLGTFICITGVSGSGKSTLINETLYPALNAHIYNGVKRPLPYKKIEGLEHIDKVIEIDQSPIGRTPRSNPATYTGVFTDIRQLFTQLPEAKIRGYDQGRFSFNTKGGRCETCQGAGMRTIEMNFLPDVYVICETCSGKRYNRETLEVRFKGKSIADVLEMTIENAVEFFEDHPKISARLNTLNDVGLGYLTLGQQSTTLSGGEAQRVKLASELSKRSTGKTFYILDEPTTGLHFEDIRLLVDVLNRLCDQGNTVLVIEHNLDIIKVSDYIIDMGPDGGSGGGQIVATGSPEELVKKGKGATAPFLAKELNEKRPVKAKPKSKK